MVWFNASEASRRALAITLQRAAKDGTELLDITLLAQMKARFEAVVGDCVDQLVRHADRYGANLIVLDQHRSKFRRVEAGR